MKEKGLSYVVCSSMIALDDGNGVFDIAEDDLIASVTNSEFAIAELEPTLDLTFV